MGHTPSDLGTCVANAVLNSAAISPDRVDHVIFGGFLCEFPLLFQSFRKCCPIRERCCLSGSRCWTTRRSVLLKFRVQTDLGVPKEKPAVTVNRLCGSGFEAVIEAARVSWLNSALHGCYCLLSISANHSWGFKDRFGGWGRIHESIAVYCSESPFWSATGHEC